MNKPCVCLLGHQSAVVCNALGGLLDADHHSSILTKCNIYSDQAHVQS